VTTFNYDDRGNLIEWVDAAGSTTTNTYDPMDRLVRTEDDLSNETSFAYDPEGNLIAATDPNGNTTRFTYDARNRRTASTDPDGGVTSFRYDSDDNLIFLTDPNGNRTRFAYDARNRLVREEDPFGEETLFRYDAVDNLTRKTDRNGRVTELAYDAVDRLTTETWRSSSEGVANTIDYTYDKASNLISVLDSVSALTFTYDNRDRVKSVNNSGTPEVPDVLLEYSYDGVGNVLSTTDTITGGMSATTSYVYDALNRMTRISQTSDAFSTSGGASDKRVDLTYNQIGQFESISRYGDLAAAQLAVTTSFTYDDLNRLTDLDHTAAGGPSGGIAFYDFEYDPASRITAITDIDGRTDFGYDDRDQLTSADRDAADARGDEAYAFDANGNRVDSHLHGDGYVTGPGNRLLSDGTFDYEYDNEGNMIRKTTIATGESREFEWDHRNRMTAVIDKDSGGVVTQRVTFTYDALDRRIAKTADTPGSG